MAESRQVYCSQLSNQAGEALYATATPTSVYLLLQYQPEWGNKALEESSLPEAVKDRLKSFSKAHPETKTLLIRTAEPDTLKHTTGANSQTDTAGEIGIAFFIARVTETAQRLYRFSLESYHDLLGIELEAFIAGDQDYTATLTDEQLVLVCTNGRRDLCCNKFGTPVSRELAMAARQYPGLGVWQSTHMGGHRFAANLLWLPQGVLYGRVDPRSAQEILAAGLNRQVHLPNLRGRTAYPEEAQAADYYLRRRTAESSLDAYRLREVRAMGENRWQVEFVSSLSGNQELVDLYREMDEQQVFESCLLDKSTRVTNYRLA